MKLIIKQYLSSLRERDELDAILPDLLSQFGLNVFSRPGRGTRQDGVDVAAVGSLDAGKEKVYLLSIKQGDLTRNTWDGDAIQSLRPSLNEILDSYIPNRLPSEHKNKDIVICICIGGDIQEPVRPLVEGYIKQNTRDNITFEEWNGDRIASLILSGFLREDLLPQNARSQLRKALALLDEPEASYKHFSVLIHSFFDKENTINKDHCTIIRQSNICLWILYAWAREADNIESAYLSSELTVLNAWELVKNHMFTTAKADRKIQEAFQSTLLIYHQINTYYQEKIMPHTKILHAMSVAVRSSSNLDVNLKLFDVLGRLAIGGIWLIWYANNMNKEHKEIEKVLRNEVQNYMNNIKQLILCNPTLLLPVKDDQNIDIAIAVLFLSLDINNNSDIINWLSQIVDRSTFAYQIHSRYPCNLNNYNELLEHPRSKDEDYLKDVTQGSVLFPMIALWAGLLGDSKLYKSVQKLKRKHLNHSTFQLWYPDENSEQYIYANSDLHGATLANVCINRSMNEFVTEAFTECEDSNYFDTLSVVKKGLWPIALIACRHYRYPIPLHLWKGIR